MFTLVNQEIGHSGRDAYWVDPDVCQNDHSFCPINAGDERTYHGKLDLSGTADLLPTIGNMSIFMLDEAGLNLFYVRFPVVGHK